MSQTDRAIEPGALRALSGEIAATCAGFNLRRASRAVSQHFDHALASVGLRMTQFTLLSALALGGSATINEISQALVIDRTTLTRNLRLLRDAGLVMVEAGRAGREQHLALTAHGRETLERAIPLWRTAQEALMVSFDQARWRGLVDDLDRLVEGAVGKHRHPGRETPLKGHRMARLRPPSHPQAPLPHDTGIPRSGGRPPGHPCPADIPPSPCCVEGEGETGAPPGGPSLGCAASPCHVGEGEMSRAG